MDRYNGILALDKDSGPTSHDVVARLRGITGQRRIGHTGTLDPQATGLLLICLGQAVKLTPFLAAWNKAYQAEITLGMISDTLDGDGRLETSGPVPDLSADQLVALLKNFVGRIRQRVPLHSAVQIRGRRLYRYAHSGQEVETPEREVEIRNIELLKIESPRIIIKVTCSKGTYIRTLADDIGRVVGCGGYLSSLRRIAVGPCRIEGALSLDEAARNHTTGILEKSIRSAEELLEFPIVRFRNKAADLIRNGSILSGNDVARWSRDFVAGELISLANEEGRILAIGRSLLDAAGLNDTGRRDLFTYVRVLV